jgi:beta-lactamase regulating signal transducer with metallopeptidase domain
MMDAVIYMIKSTVCLGVFFLFYRLFLTKDTNFKFIRAYLLISIVASLILPLSKYSLNVDLFKTYSAKVNSAKVATTTHAEINQSNNEPLQIANDKGKAKNEASSNINWFNLSIMAYLLIALFFLGRLLIQVIQLFIIILQSPVDRKGSYVLVYSYKISNSLSFFHWIILNKNNIGSDEIEKILAHEKVHVSQYHTIDLIAVELLAAVMWFNPAIWMMRNAIQLVHEYLADEGALNTGLDKLRYQALLVNQAAEEKLI